MEFWYQHGWPFFRPVDEQSIMHLHHPVISLSLMPVSRAQYFADIAYHANSLSVTSVLGHSILSLCALNFPSSTFSSSCYFLCLFLLPHILRSCILCTYEVNYCLIQSYICHIICCINPQLSSSCYFVLLPYLNE